MSAFTIDQPTTILFEASRTDMLNRMLQKEVSDLAGYATILPDCTGDYHKLTFGSNTELVGRTDFDEVIKAEEMTYNVRGIKPLMYERWHKFLPEKTNFMRNFPLTTTNVVNELRPALERAKDFNLMGTIVDTKKSSPTEGEVIVRKHNTYDESAENGNPMKMGATSGYFGDAYAGKTGDASIELPMQPYVDGTGLVTKWDEYDESVALDMKRSNVVPVNYVPSGSATPSGWTVDKFILVYEMLQARYANKRGTIVHAITHRQAAEILRNEKFQNLLFGNQVLKTGLMDSLFGIKFLVTDTLPLVNIGDGGSPKWVRACPTWCVEDLVFGVWDDAEFHIRQPQDRVKTVYLGCTFAMGSGRKREESCITMLCDEGFKPKGD